MADLTGTQVARNYNKAAAGAFYGLSPRIFTVATSSASVASADTGSKDTSGGSTTLGNYSKSIRAIETVASIILAGNPAANSKSFTVIIDDTYNGSHTAGTDPTTADAAAAGLKAAIAATTGISASDITVTEVVITGTAFV